MGQGETRMCDRAILCDRTTYGTNHDDDQDVVEGAESAMLDAGSDADEMDAMPELDSEDEDAMFDDEDEVPADFEQDEQDESKQELSQSQKKRKERKKLKQLPVFASADDYAKMMGDDDDEDM